MRGSSSFPQRASVTECLELQCPCTCRCGVCGCCRHCCYPVLDDVPGRFLPANMGCRVLGLESPFHVDSKLATTAPARHYIGTVSHIIVHLTANTAVTNRSPTARRTPRASRRTSTPTPTPPPPRRPQPPLTRPRWPRLLRPGSSRLLWHPATGSSTMTRAPAGLRWTAPTAPTSCPASEEVPVLVSYCC